jgi:4-aminobutyrate aminotransferase
MTDICRSEQLFTTLRSLAAAPKTSKLISEVRGQGLMVAMEFRTPSDELSVCDLPEGERSSVPKDIGKRVQKICIDQGLLILTTSCFDTIRFIPALTITEEEMSQALAIFKGAVEQVAREG